MLLRRLGNKKIIAKEIIKYFPEHDIYIDFFLEQEEYFLINNLQNIIILMILIIMYIIVLMC